ncbi:MULTISPECIES: phage major capsid protein [Bacillus]|uniref:phage major capsid protein n=1 Tax=Bacillus TaxID=1386 RepID=UPI000403D6C7|nr:MULTISPECIES: phage major capsid protein [Bacillus]MDH3105378.1 phage major capsid protein [Bacillus velezensis]MEE4536839.1 phage major capsid protein [Bacillus velezensis]QHK02792.1 Phage-like element PBSX protein XkdG [Bacillus velezensis]QLG05962.1 hypothetical protein GJS30_02140 [Bacillus velezensis]TWO90641.1 hypothetical protein EUA42_19350 [Bacillus velezensis]
MRNQEVIEKAEMTLASLKSGGMMNPTQANAFIRMVQDAPTILNEARVIPMDHDTQKIEKIGFGQRILRAAQEGVSLTKDQKVAPTTSTVSLSTKEVIAEVNITYDTLENNIEKEGLQNTIMQMLAERAAVDIEELLVNGDAASSDSYLAQIDGIRKQATSHIVDVADVKIRDSVSIKSEKPLPLEFTSSNVTKEGRLKVETQGIAINPADFESVQAKTADIVFHDKVETPGEGNILKVGSFKTLLIEVYGTAVTSELKFWGKSLSGTKRPLRGQKVDDGTLAISTVGKSEAWTFDITGFKEIVMEITALNNGNFSVKGTAVS